MQKIIPHLWFDKEAREATEFYTSLFKDSKVTYVSTLQGTPSGDTDIVSFTLAGQEFQAISAGPYFKFNPSISFSVSCSTFDEVNALWDALSKNGKVFMELGEYPFNKRYGWIQDRYGLSWQVGYSEDSEIKQKITPTLMFTGKVSGKAEEAIRFYNSVFHNTNIDMIARYETGMEPDKEGTVMYASFQIESQQFAAMDSARVHDAPFNEAISFIVECKTQEEIDYYWEKISAVPQAEQCGWLKDKYGVSWQIVPEAMADMMKSKNPEKVARVTEAFLKMKKFNIAELERAFAGK